MAYTLITGASSGVGRELAIYLSKTRQLILNGRNRERLEETKQHCEKPALVWEYDLASYKSLEFDLAKWLGEQQIEIEAFVHCAGVMNMTALRGVNAEILENTYAVNIFAPELIMKVLTSKRCNKKNLKSAVFISSNISNRGAAAFSVYGASKSALDGLMRNLSVELAPDIRVNTILPGGMLTEMTKEIFSDENVRKEMERNYPLGLGTPYDIAPAAEYLLSEQSRWITGQQLTIDGGRTIDITERRK